MKFRRLTISREVLSQVVANEAVLLDMRTEKYFGLNPVGLRVWEMLQETSDLRAIRDRLLSEYHVAAEDLDRDLEALFDHLVAAGLAQEPVDGSP